VFSRWDEEVVRFTIERGRPGTPMPPWGVDFGGPMTQQMIDDVIAWLHSIQVDPPAISDDCGDINSRNEQACGEVIFEARCAVCHGPEGQGKEDTAKVVINPGDLRCVPPSGSPDAPECPKGPKWWQGLALWQGDVNHLDEDQHLTTITNGRRFAFMPQFGEAPAQGIPAPPVPLTEAQIRAVMAYERSL
jgi:mono/diheme cytochrome c family protein